MLVGSIRGQRVGAASPVVLVLLPGLILLAAVAVYSGLGRESHTEAQNAADAAAMAATLALATDDRLVGDGTDQLLAATVFARSRDAATTLLGVNLGGYPRGFDTARDIVFGSLAHPQDVFTPYDAAAGGAWITVNAVQVTIPRASGHRHLVRATAMLDWSVVGFRPRNDGPIPLMPIAVFTDHTGNVSNGWDAQLQAARAQGNDTAAFDRGTRQFSSGPDGIPEVTVILGARDATDGTTAPPAAILQVGVNTFAETVEQVRVGTRAAELGTESGAIYGLGDDNTLNVPGTPEAPALGTADRDSLDGALSLVHDSGEPRIWPLFSGVTTDGSAVRVTGWMSARIVSVSAANGGGIKLVLQPAVISHPSVVTERRDNPPVFWATNRTVAQLRLAK